MRLKLEFELKKKEFPADYSRTMISFFKNALEEYDKRAYEENYMNGNLSKAFTFSISSPESFFEKGKRILEANILFLTFSSSDFQSLAIFLSAFNKQRKKAFRLAEGNEMILEKITMLPEEEITLNTVRIKTMSPILAQIHHHESNKSWYYSVEDDEFEDVLVKVISRRLRDLGIAGKVEIRRVQAKKTVVSTFGLKIPASIGVFDLSASQEIIQRLYDEGIGSRRNAGFGMFRIIKN